MRNSAYLQRLRDPRYLHPIPIRMSHSYKEHSEPITRAPKRDVEPWIPIEGVAEAIPRKKYTYVPPLRPPTIIVTRRPFKTSFNVPLTKSIQVSPNIQTTGYIRKHRIKLPEITTTLKPQLKQPGSLAEGTVHSSLNFTLKDEGWRPKVFTTPIPSVQYPNNYNHRIVPERDTHEKFTRVRISEVNSAVPENGRQFGIRQNKTDYLTKFISKDIKISPENKGENAQSHFYPTNSEEKHSFENSDNHKTFNHELTSSPKIISNLWKEGNKPYQGHLSSLQKKHIVKNGAENGDSIDPYRDWKTIFDSVQSTRNLRTNVPKKDAAQSQNQGSYINDPYNGEIFNSAFINKGNRNQNSALLVKEKHNNQHAKSEPAVSPNVHANNQSIHLESSNTYNAGATQNQNSDFPYQGYAILVKRPSYYDSKYSSDNIKNNSYHSQHSNRFPNKPIISADSTQIAENDSGRKQIYDENFKSSPSNTSLHNGMSHSFVKNQESDNDKILKYNSISNNYKNNNTLETEKVIVAEIPVAIGDQYNISKLPNIHTDSKFENRSVPDNLSNRERMKIYMSNPKLQSFAPMSNYNFSLLHRNQNIRLVSDVENPEKVDFIPSPKLKEVELKNPPEHLEFGDEDFLKPIIPIHFHKDSNTNKKVSTFKFSAQDRTGERGKPAYATTRDSNKMLLMTTTTAPLSKVEYDQNVKLDGKTLKTESPDTVYFQPVFPEVSFNNHKTPFEQKFQNYNSDQSSQQTFSDGDRMKKISSDFLGNQEKSKVKSFSELSGRGEISKIKSSSDLSYKEDTMKVKPHSDLTSKKIFKSQDEPRETLKNNKVIITKNPEYSPKDIKKNNIEGVSNDMPKIITSPPVITMKYDPKEVDVLSTRDSTNRSDNYVIQRKPALLPESANRPKKPKIMLTTGMLAGILIAALIFLAFLTGSMVYAFHQWKFGRKKSDRQKKKISRAPRFPPEYLDENFAGNTYIHNNIFLPTPQNSDDRNSTEPDTSSTAGDEVLQEPTSSSARVRRHPGVYRETREE